MEDALVSLTLMYKLIWHNHQPTVRIRHFDQPAHCLVEGEESDDKTWFYDIKPYLEKLPIKYFNHRQANFEEVSNKVLLEWKCVLQNKL